MKPVEGYIMTATPAYSGDNCTDFTASLALAAQHCILRGVWLEPRFANGFSLVEYARNWFVAEFLASKATHLFWIDSDLYFPPDAIYKLFSKKLDVVAGVYVTKHETNPIFPYQAVGPVDEKTGLQLASKVPGGFLCMSRNAIEKTVRTCKWHEIDHNGDKRNSPRLFDLQMDGNKKLVGEDFVACERLRKAGFKIYVEPNISFIHYGRRGWKGNLAETLKEEAALGFEGQGSVGVKSVSDKPADRD